MSFQVIIQPSGRQIEVEPGETVLEAALRQGITLPYGCRNGACGSCKGKLVQGQVDYGDYAAHILPEYEKKAGYALFCRAKPLCDLVIEARIIAAAGQLEVKKMPCRVQRIERPAPDVVIMHLSLPANERLQFLAGQYLEIILRDGKRRAYSMANPPEDDNTIELHVRNNPGGVFTDYVFNRMKEKDILRFEGPLGTFFLREDSDKPIVFLASGTGFAPIKSILMHAFRIGLQREMVLYWGGRRPHDLYLSGLCREWQAQHPNFSFVPVVSDALPEDNWPGRTGFVHLAVLEDFPDLSAYQVYACGAPIVVESAKRDFTAQCRLPEDEFYADSFTPAPAAATP
jgi:CDP-4-dehydro-6-deoxyglucose reductase